MKVHLQVAGILIRYKPDPGCLGYDNSHALKILSV